jgi:sigma-B regulation protein RsbU (phosphoserine phosphatase)
VENLPQSIFRKDREGRFQFGNPRFCAGVGHPLDEILGKTDADFFPPHLAAAYRQSDLRLMESGQFLDQVEEHVGADGRKQYVQVVKTPLCDASGAIIGIQGIFWDISARKQTEAERDQLIQELQKALANVKSLSGLLPICSGCKKIRDDKGYWNQVESYVQRHSEATFTHGLCPVCMKKYFPDA